MTTYNSDRTFLLILNMLWLLACLFSVGHVLLKGQPLTLVYCLILAVFIAVFVIFILSIIRKKSDYAKGFTPLGFILLVYLVLISWIGLTGTMPEFQQIKEFEESRSDLAFKIHVKRKGENYVNVYRWEMAKLYLHAPAPVNRVEKNVNHKGTMMMHALLQKEIEKGNGKLFADDMYMVAEVAFVYGKKFALQWYKNAYKYGRSNALDRYRARVLEINPNYKFNELDHTGADNE